MKKFILVVILAMTSTFVSKAQDYEAELDSLSREQAARRSALIKPELAPSAPMAVFSELGGISFLGIGFNYEYRFERRLNGWGLRAGLNFTSDDGIGGIVVPVQLNYLLGRRGRYFEVGAGTTFLTHYNRLMSKVYYYNDEPHLAVVGTMSMGFRYQPVGGGLMFMFGNSPWIAKKSDGGLHFEAFMPYFAIGYSF